MKKNSYLIREYESIVASKNAPTGYHTVSQNIFDGLELFLLSHQESLSFMNLSVKRGLGKVLTAKNYAGIIDKVEEREVGRSFYKCFRIFRTDMLVKKLTHIGVKRARVKVIA